ncbi:MAG: hypothetical protein ACTTJ6_01040 [Treponema sp.]
MDLSGIPFIGWIVILVVAFLIFILLMIKGVKLAFGDNSLSIGGKLDKKIDGVKKELIDKANNTLHDEQLRIILYRKSITIDEHLNADLRKIVRRLDGKICTLLEPFSNSFFLSMGISEIIKGELNERIDYNNIREKLSGRERKEYLEDILSDIKDKYSTFLLHLLKQSRDINEYPDWETIEKSIRDLINNWEEEVISLLSHHIGEKIKIYGEKIKIYIDAKDDFKTVEYVENSITYPIEKNKKYLKELGGNVCSY